DLPRRLPALPDPALDGQIRAALVWRGSRCLVHLPRLLPGRPAGGLLLRARPRDPPLAPPGARAPRRAPVALAGRARAPLLRVGIADPPRGRLEAEGPRPPDRADPRDPGGERGASVPAALLYQPARPIVGRAHPPGSPGLPPLRP